MAVNKGRNANVKISGTGVVSAGEATTDVGGAHTTYQITNIAHQVLDPQATITVKKNGTAQSAALYTLDRLYGKAVFFTPLLGTDTVTIDVTYLPMTSVVQANSWDATMSGTPLDATVFVGNGGWVQKVQGEKDASGTIGRLYASDLDLSALWAASDTPIVVEMWDNASTDTEPALRAWALVVKDDQKAAPNQLVGETINWVGTPDANGRVVSAG